MRLEKEKLASHLDALRKAHGSATGLLELPGKGQNNQAKESSAPDEGANDTTLSECVRCGITVPAKYIKMHMGRLKDERNLAL